MSSVLKTALAAACLLAFAAPVPPAQAQSIKVNPRVGLYVPLTDLGELTTTAGTVVAEKSGSLALGLGVELGLGGSLGLRANTDYVTGSEIQADGSVSEGTEAKMLVVAGDLVYRPLPRLIVVQPYLFAGAGLRQYDFSEDNTQALEDASDPTIHLGGGVDLSLGSLGLNAEIGDYISWYEAQEGSDAVTQHDMFVSIGLVFGL